MLHDPTRHEPLLPIAWDEQRVRKTIAHIVSDTEQHFSPERYWPLHPRDVEGDEDPNQLVGNLYYGACGVIWALHHLQTVGAAHLSRSYLGNLDDLLPTSRTNNAACKGAFGRAAARLWSAEQRRACGPRAQRGSTTDSPRLFERSEQSERSEFGGGAGRPSSTGQSERSADRSSEALQPARTRLCCANRGVQSKVE